MNKSQNHNDLDLAFREHGAFLRRIALALTSDPWEADDATQDAFLAAAQSQSEGQESMRAWLATVLRRTIQKRRRSQSRRQLREIATAKTEGHILESRESLFRNLAELVTMLPRDVQSLLIRRYWESLSAREIAEQDGLSKSTVESRIRRAMETLRRHMDERSGGNRATWALALLASTTKSSGLGWKEGLILMSLKKITGAVVVAILLVLVFFSSGFFESDDPVALESSSKRAENEVSPEIRRSELLVASPVTEPRLAKTTVAEANGPRAIPNFPQGDLAVRLRTSKGELASNRLILATAIDREVGLVEVAAHTDAAGMAYFRGLPAGRHELVCPRAGQRTATIVVGQETKVDWTLCAAKELEGRVIDATGAPIAGAHIHLSLAVDPNHFAAVATTDEAGGFHLDGVESDYLVVTAAGFIPSPIMEILDQDRRPLVATLEKGGRSLEVAIVNENNEALADAWCRIVDFSVSELVKPGATGMSPDGERHEHLQTNFGHSLRSDAKGKLKIGGLGLGSLRIEARALGFEGRSLSI